MKLDIGTRIRHTTPSNWSKLGIIRL